MKKTYLLASLGIGILAISATSVAFAATNNNYGSWQSIMGNRAGVASRVVTEKNFNQYTEMHQLMADGKYAEAQKVRTDLGLGAGQGNGAGGCNVIGAGGQGSGCGMHNGGAGHKANFVDENGNGICDRMESLNK